MNVELPMSLLDWMTENKMCNLKEKKIIECRITNLFIKFDD